MQRRHPLGAVPVLDASGGVAGLVSEHDLLARTGKVARDMMTSAVISVTEDTDVDDVRLRRPVRRWRWPTAAAPGPTAQR